MRILQIGKELVWLIVTTAPWNKKTFVSKSNARHLRTSFERLGSVFIKLGQMLALRPDFVPGVFTEELYTLLDRVPPFDYETAQNILKTELGSSSSKLLLLDATPVASASFAQVYKGRLQGGELVAIKLQRPHIDKLVRDDLIILKVLAKVFDVLFQPANRASLIVREFEAWTMEELNYKLEAQNIAKFNIASAQVNDGIRGPHVYAAFSTAKVLTMEYIEGRSLNHITSVQKYNHKEFRALGFDGKEVMGKLMRNILEMSHVHGFFHADPHPANIIFTSKKELVFIDFGIMGALSLRERTLVLRYFRTLLDGDADESFDALIEFCGQKHPDNLEFVKDEYRKLIVQFTKTFTAKTYLEQQIRSGPILVETIRLLQKNGIAIPTSIVRYFKAFETVEGLIFAIYPEFAIRDMAREFRRVSIINIVTAFPSSFEKKYVRTLVFSIIDSLERLFILQNSIRRA